MMRLFARHLEAVGSKHIDDGGNDTNRQYPGFVGSDHIKKWFDCRIKRRQVSGERAEQNDRCKDPKTNRTDELRPLTQVFRSGDKQHEGRQQDQKRTGS